MDDEDDDDNKSIYGMAVGDLAIIGIAAVFTLTAVYLVLSPAPLASLFPKTQAAPAPSGEVMVGVPPKPKN